MNNKIYKRIFIEKNYILNDNMTIRQIAKKMNISKSTVHKDLHERLLIIDEKLFEKVKQILNEHIKIRHIHGGNATRLKYAKLKRG